MMMIPDESNEGLFLLLRTCTIGYDLFPFILFNKKSHLCMADEIDMD